LYYHRFTIGLCYNVFSGYALSSYLEYPILVGQVLLLLALLLHYSRRIGSKWLAAFGVYSAVVYALSTGMFPGALLVTLMVKYLFCFLVERLDN
jgi:hypothetical protein